MGESSREPATPSQAQHRASYPAETLDAHSPYRDLSNNVRNDALKFDLEFDGGWDQARGRTAEPSGSAPLLGGSGVAPALGGHAAGTLGHAAFLSGAAADAVAAHSDEWGLVAVPVEPHFEVCERGIAEQQQFVVDQRPESDPIWVQRGKSESKKWATANMTTLLRYEAEQTAACTGYSTWIPFANASHAALAELLETARLLGFDLSKPQDVVRFVKGTERSLDMANSLVHAKVLGADGKASWASRGEHVGVKTNAQPDFPGTELTSGMTELIADYGLVQTTHMAVYEDLLAERIKVDEAQGAEIGAKIAAIDDVIRTWSAIGSTFDHVGTAFNSASRVGARVDAAAKVSQGKREARHGLDNASKYARAFDPDHSEDAEGDAALSQSQLDNFHDYNDNWGQGRASVKANGPRVLTAPAPAQIPIPPLSVGGLFEFSAKLVFASDLDGFKRQLEGLESKEHAESTSKDTVAAQRHVDAFANARKALAGRFQQLSQRGLNQRQQDFVSLGHQLDDYATEHAPALAARGQSALVPAANHETYATLGAVLGKIEQYRMVTQLALATLDYDSVVHNATQQQLERAGSRHASERSNIDEARVYGPPPRLAAMSEPEVAVYQQIAGTYLTVQRQHAHWELRFENVIPKFKTLLVSMADAPDKANATEKQY